MFADKYFFSSYQSLLARVLSIWYRHSFFPDELLYTLLQEFVPDWQKESKAAFSISGTSNQHHSHSHHHHNSRHHRHGHNQKHSETSSSSSNWGKVSTSSHRTSTAVSTTAAAAVSNGSNGGHNNNNSDASGSGPVCDGPPPSITTSSLFTARIQEFRANIEGLGGPNDFDDDDEDVDDEGNDPGNGYNGNNNNLEDRGENGGDGTPTEAEPPYVRPPPPPPPQQSERSSLSGAEMTSKIGNIAAMVNNMFASSDRRLATLSHEAEKMAGPQGSGNFGTQPQPQPLPPFLPPPISSVKCYTPPEIAPNSQYMPPPPPEFLALGRGEVARRGEERGGVMPSLLPLPHPPAPPPYQPRQPVLQQQQQQQQQSMIMDMDVDEGPAYEPEDSGISYPDSSSSLAALRERTMYDNLSRYSIKVHPAQHLQQHQQQQHRYQEQSAKRPTPPYVDSTSNSAAYQSRSRSRSPPPSASQHESVVQPQQQQLSRQQIKDAAAAETERIRLRKVKGMPITFKPNCLVIGSTTLWIGHVPKFASESDLSDYFGDYGELRSINVSWTCIIKCSNLIDLNYKHFSLFVCLLSDDPFSWLRLHLHGTTHWRLPSLFTH